MSGEGEVARLVVDLRALFLVVAIVRRLRNADTLNACTARRPFRVGFKLPYPLGGLGRKGVTVETIIQVKDTIRIAFTEDVANSVVALQVVDDCGLIEGGPGVRLVNAGVLAGI